MSKKIKSDDDHVHDILNKIDAAVEFADTVIRLSNNKVKKLQNITFNKRNSSNLNVLKKIKNDFYKVESKLDGSLLLNKKIIIENRLMNSIKWYSSTNTLVLNFTNEMLKSNLTITYYFWKYYFYVYFLPGINNRILNWDDFIFNSIKSFGIKAGIITREEVFTKELFYKIEFYVGKSDDNIELLANILSFGIIGILYKNKEVIDKAALEILKKIIKLNK